MSDEALHTEEGTVSDTEARSWNHPAPLQFPVLEKMLTMSEVKIFELFSLANIESA